MDEVKLLPCPHCAGNGADAQTEDDGYAYVICVCTAQGPLRMGEEAAIAAWNTRAIEATDEVVVKLARNALRDEVFKTADDNLHRAVESAIYRMHNSEIARQLLRFVAATRPPIGTDEVVERVARAIRGKHQRLYGLAPLPDCKELARAAIAAMKDAASDGGGA